jgi:hypothetical protein
MLKVSPAFLVALAVSGLLGAIGGSAFLWASSGRAWNILIAAFLWTLISAAGTTLGRYVGERLRRGAWRRGLWIAGAMSFPLTTVYSLVAFSIIATAEGTLRPMPMAVLPFFYGATLCLALVLGLSWVLTSPFRQSET